MKSILMFAIILAASIGIAASPAKKQTGKNRQPASQLEIDRSALEILLRNSGILTTDPSVKPVQKLSEVLARTIVSSKKFPQSIENTCRLDKNDDVFKCSMVVSSSAVEGGSKLESQTTIKYELEVLQNGLPSPSLMFLTFEVETAG